MAKALLDPTERVPELVAVNEAAIGALFAHIDRNLTIELDHAQEPDLPVDYDRCYWRRLIAACQGERNDEFYVEVDSTDSEDWSCLIESLQDGILWDNDWDMPELFMDVKPELSDERKERLGIERDYFVSPSPDLQDAEVLAAFSGLRRLIGDDR